MGDTPRLDVEEREDEGRGRERVQSTVGEKKRVKRVRRRKIALSKTRTEDLGFPVFGEPCTHVRWDREHHRTRPSRYRSCQLRPLFSEGRRRRGTKGTERRGESSVGGGKERAANKRRRRERRRDTSQALLEALT